MRNQIVYIAGKISGDPDYKQKFADAEAFLSRGGYTVLNPTVLPEGLRYDEYMRICMAMIDVADVVFFLKNWQESPGARFERHYCDLIKKTVGSVETRESVAW